MFLIYLGDSRAFILHRNGDYTIMSRDHKPNDPQEVARINRAGGFVSRTRKVFRVDGTLSVSRAFGDIVSLKQIIHCLQHTRKPYVYTTNA